MKRSTITAIICYLLIFLFTYTALSKLINHDIFHAELIIFPWIKWGEPILSWALPLFELTVVSLLIMPKLRLYGLYASFILLILFTLYLSLMIISGVKLPCSCGGVIQYLTWKQHIVFNLFFMLLSLSGVLIEKQNGKMTVNHIVA